MSGHDYNTFKDQVKYLDDEQLASKLKNNTFFNPEWSQEQTESAVQKAYSELRNAGKTGKQTVKIDGEEITVVTKEDGTFDTAYGNYKLKPKILGGNKIICDISYKIFNSKIDEKNDNELQGRYGYFKITAGQHFYGNYIEDKEVDILSVSIDNWFLNFGKALQMLKKSSEAYISDTETPSTWIKLNALSDEEIEVALIMSEKVNGSLGVEASLANKIDEIEWSEKVDKQSLVLSFKKAFTSYISEVEVLNQRIIRNFKHLKVFI